jgi:hypothetical protein
LATTQRRSPRDAPRYGALFRAGLNETGIIDGQSPGNAVGHC